MVKKQTLLHGVAFILWGTLILPVSAADNLHFSGSLVASLLVSLWCLNSRIAIRR